MLGSALRVKVAPASPVLAPARTTSATVSALEEDTKSTGTAPPSAPDPPYSAPVAKRGEPSSTDSRERRAASSVCEVRRSTREVPCGAVTSSTQVTALAGSAPVAP